MLSGEVVVESGSDVELGTISGMWTVNSLFYVPQWLQINLDGTATRIDVQLSKLIPSGQTPVEFRSHFTRHSESHLQLGIWSRYTVIWCGDQAIHCDLVRGSGELMRTRSVGIPVGIQSLCYLTLCLSVVCKMLFLLKLRVVLRSGVGRAQFH